MILRVLTTNAKSKELKLAQYLEQVLLLSVAFAAFFAVVLYARNNRYLHISAAIAVGIVSFVILVVAFVVVDFWKARSRRSRT